jgi:hypothetical protein
VSENARPKVPNDDVTFTHLSTPRSGEDDVATACDHGVTIATYVERCAGCGDWVVRRSPEEATLRAELLTLREALERARDHLRFNGWKNDPRSGRRAKAVQEVERALSTPQEPE